MKDQAPLPSATVLPSDVPPDETATVSLQSSSCEVVSCQIDVIGIEIPESDDAPDLSDAAATSVIASETSLGRIVGGIRRYQCECISVLRFIIRIITQRNRPGRAVDRE